MSAVLPRPLALPAAWRLPLAVWGGLVLLLLWQYRSTFITMVGIWERSGTFAHAFLVPPITLWLVWRLRDQVAGLRPQAMPLVLLPVALVGLGWLVGEVAGVNAITQLCVTALLVLTVPLLFGRAVTSVLFFPLCFLFFMVPVGEFVMPTMMEWTADVTIFTVAAIGIPVYREGLQFVIPSGSWSVVEACSGVRYLIASVMVGSLFAYLNYNSTKRRVAFAVFSLVVPVVANWARAVMIVLLGHYSGNKLAVGVDHLIYGWVFFGVVIGIMFVVGARWSEPELPPPAPGTRPVALGAGAWPTAAWATAAALAVLLLAPPLAADGLQGGELRPVALQLPALAGATADDGAAPLHQPAFERPRAQASRVYRADGRLFTVHVAYYRQQTYGQKLVNSQNALVHSNDKLWRVVTQGQGTLRGPDGDVAVRTAQLRGGSLIGASGQELLQVRQLYWVDGHFTTSDHVAALRGVQGLLSGRGDDAAALTIYVAGGDEAARAALDTFTATQLPALQQWLSSVRAQR